MVEESKERNERKEINETKKDEKPKQSLFSKLKKPLMTGVMAAGLLLTPMKGNAVQLKDTMSPPIEYSEIYEKNYQEGWKYLLKANKIIQDKKTRSKNYYDKAIDYFENRYKTDKRAESLYALGYSYYARTLSQKTYEDAESDFEMALQLSEEGIKQFKLPIFGGLKATILQNRGQMYANAYQKYCSIQDKEKAIKYLNDFLHFSKIYKQGADENVIKRYNELEETTKQLLITLQK